MTAPDSRDSVESAPIGTKAPAIMGGHWYRTERGWKWNGPDGTGGVFPRPGGDWTGQLIPPALARGPQQAGGEDAVQAAARIASEAACLRIDNERLQAEVARLRESLNERQSALEAVTLIGANAEAALREAHEGEVSQVEWEDSDRIIVHIEKDEGDVMMWEDVREGVRVRIAGPRLVRDGDSGEG